MSRYKPAPAPGQSVRGSKTGRPIMALLDLLGRRGALRIVWELREEARNFRALLEAADSNPSGLNTRLKELRAAGIVELGGDGYGLTAHGKALFDCLMPLHHWADQWAQRQRRPS
jgi:DNA-binding HxlR family transcriptional regulator